MRILCFALFTLSFSVGALADQLKDDLARLRQMENAGAITKEAASKHRLFLRDSRAQGLRQRGEAQRSLASVDPVLAPQPIKRFRAAPLVLFLDEP